MKEKDLTQLEIARLTETFNLTDGHAHRSWDANEQTIVDRIQELFTNINREQQTELEAEYITNFYKLGQQTVDHKKTKYLFLQSASMSLEIIGNYLRLKGLDLALIEPCFDNLTNLYKRHNVPLEPIPDTFLEAEEGFEEMLEGLKSRAICIVSPNNPTGISYTKRNFERLVKHCKQHGKLLILDSCFRSYRQPGTIFDEYALLQESGIDYIIVEDTGKTWPTKELKVSILAMSDSIFRPIYDIYTDFIYHHSPFVVGFVNEFVKNSIADNLHNVHEVVRTNRETLLQATADSFLIPANKGLTNVAWFRLNSQLNSGQVVEILAAHGLFILPGNHFFWSDKTKGDEFIRIALVRDPALFAKAAQKLQQTLADAKLWPSS